MIFSGNPTLATSFRFLPSSVTTKMEPLLACVCSNAELRMNFNSCSSSFIEEIFSLILNNSVISLSRVFSLISRCRSKALLITAFISVMLNEISE